MMNIVMEYVTNPIPFASFKAQTDHELYLFFIKAIDRWKTLHPFICTSIIHTIESHFPLKI